MRKEMFVKQSCHELSSDHHFNGIDLVKFVCAYLVCIIHFAPFDVEAIGIDGLRYINWGLQQYLCRIAVPFYFVSSGFLLFRKIDIKNLSGDRVKDYCFRILRLLGTWTVLLFVGSRDHLWYLGAVVFAVIVISFLLKKRLSLLSVFLISIILYVIGLLGDSYYGFIEPLKDYFVPKFFIVGYETFFYSTKNGLFFGLIFVFMGVIFAQRRIVMNSVIAVVGLFASLGLMFFEEYYLYSHSIQKDFNMTVFLLPVTFFLFYLATHVNLKNRIIYGSLRKIGLLIFFIHILVSYSVNVFINLADTKLGIQLAVFRFLMIIGFSTVIAIAIEMLSKKKQFNWLKYLFS